MIEIKQIIDIAVKNNLSFYIFRKPGETAINIGITTSDMIEKGCSPDPFLNKNGFIFAPFNKKNNLFFINPEISLTFDNDIAPNIDRIMESLSLLAEKEKNNNHPEFNDRKKTISGNLSNFSSLKYSDYKNTSRTEYENSFKSFKELLDKGILSKIILSRRIVSNQSSINDIFHILESLLKRYESAFVYLVFIPFCECWCGATPETFLVSNENGFETMSLAGTSIYTPEIENPANWDNKDLEEQQFVTNYIKEVLLKSDISNWEELPISVRKAGAIAHLLTVFKGYTPIDNRQISYLVNTLHPTPAICGIPASLAEKEIKQTELYDREFYCGYLGHIENNGNLNLYVNLRCAKILDDGIVVFVGGGLTKDSVSDNEWEETTLKSRTILNAITDGE